MQEAQALQRIGLPPIVRLEVKQLSCADTAGAIYGMNSNPMPHIPKTVAMRRYEFVVDLIKRGIRTGTLRVGDRLPSVRQLSEDTGYSPMTVHHAYELLEAEGVCEARPRSGFYVVGVPAPVTDPAKNGHVVHGETVKDLPEALLHIWYSNELGAFGSFYPSPDLFDRNDIDRLLRQLLRQGETRLVGCDSPQGDVQLRHEISRRASRRGSVVAHGEIVVGNTGMSCFDMCLNAFTKPGDVILVESPSYFPMLAGLNRKSLSVVEIYSHPRSGIDPEQFLHLVRSNSVRVALLMGSNHYPTGVTYSEQTMRRVVEIARQHQVLILESDMFSDLNYDGSRQPSFKQHDPSDIVVQFGSFMASLPPAYGLGWIIAGTHTRRLMTHQYAHGLNSGDGIVQRAIATFLATRSQDRHLRQLRGTLAARMQRGLDLIAEHFPSECVVSPPVGGYMCWVRGPVGFDATSALLQAIESDFSFLPGPIFSIEASFRNFVALNFSFPWIAQNETYLAKLGEMMHRSLGR
ncbi:PLP-dependent aminotransferase family protein [Mesorhizobium sp. M0955]|uniref:aminotransferase-like domain-containing protein n=1 Tax=Mesorhizobium sp. M0955 TaxID=2957033 RepID=UPI00333D8203